ncbi:hypothetical protein M2243_001530 [Heliophilum fasciatum]|nr:hypothetical protein [Heliophilum fasciatum]
MAKITTITTTTVDRKTKANKRYALFCDDKTGFFFFSLLVIINQKGQVDPWQ